jgi:hypothetical protein
MILGDPTIPVVQGTSVLDAFLGVSPGYLQKKLEGIELLLYLSTAAGLAGAIVSAFTLRRR